MEDNELHDTFISRNFCNERYKNMEKMVSAINKKFWAIVLLLMAQAVYVIYRNGGV